MRKFRKLNQEGCRQFINFLESGAKEDVPLKLLESKKTSVETNFYIEIARYNFTNKYDFGVYLNELLKDIPDNEIENDSLFWNTMSMLFFDTICYRTSDGARKVQAMEKWIMAKGNPQYYRLLVRSPWLFVRIFGETAKFLLISRHQQPSVLSIVPETLEQFGSRGILLRNEKIVKLFSKLYFDYQNQEPKPGLSGNAAGSPRRMGKVVRQLALTHDLERMTEQELIDILPREFDRWIDWL